MGSSRDGQQQQHRKAPLEKLTLLVNELLVQQVWPLTRFFLFPFCKKSLICPKGKSMTPLWGNPIFCSPSQQLPRLRLRPLKGSLS